MSTVYSAVIMTKKSIHHKTDEHKSILCSHVKDADMCVRALKRYYERLDDLYGRRIYVSTQIIYRKHGRYKSSTSNIVWSGDQIWTTWEGMGEYDIVRSFLRVTRNDRNISFFKRFCCCVDRKCDS